MVSSSAFSTATMHKLTMLSNQVRQARLLSRRFPRAAEATGGRSSRSPHPHYAGQSLLNEMLKAPIMHCLSGLLVHRANDRHQKGGRRASIAVSRYQTSGRSMSSFAHSSMAYWLAVLLVPPSLAAWQGSVELKARPPTPTPPQPPRLLRDVYRSFKSHPRL